MTATDGGAEVLEVVGGVAGLEATYDAMLGLAAAYDDAADRLRTAARWGARVATDPDLLESSLLSPATAVRAEAAVLAATTGPDGVLVESARWEVDAVAVRAAVELFRSADQAQGAAFDVLDHLVARQLGSVVVAAPGLVAGAVVVGGDDLERQVVEHPAVVEHLANGAGGLVTGLSLGLAPTLGGRQAASRLAALYPEGTGVATRLHDEQASARVAGGRPRDLQDLLAHLDDVAALSSGPDSPHNGTIEIQTLTRPDGSVAHIVNLPGTDDLTTRPWSADDDVRDLGTNLALLAREPDDYQQGVVDAMVQAGIAPGEPVLLVGHSQGGMVAAALAARGTGFTITDVVTAGSPTGQVGDLPEGVRHTALVQHGDPVPHLDGEPASTAVGQTTVVFDARPDGGVVAHHERDVYVAGAAAADASTHPSVVANLDALRAGGFLATEGAPEPGGVTSQVFRITRRP